jgi:hypothetical protein
MVLVNQDYQNQLTSDLQSSGNFALEAEAGFRRALLVTG